MKFDTVTRDAITDHIRTGGSKVTRSQWAKDSSNVASRPQKPEGLLGTGPGQPPRLSRAKDDHPAVLVEGFCNWVSVPATLDTTGAC